MARALPPLALEMSMDGIALHQLTFDGHWHELSRIGLNDPALREKMANMRENAVRIGGRGAKTRIWLPDDQMLQHQLRLSSATEDTRRAEARKLITETTPLSAKEFDVIVGEKPEDGLWQVVAVRKSTMIEARNFAKSHGFTGILYSTRSKIAGFGDQPHFGVPASMKRAASLGMVAVLFAGVVLAGGFAYQKLGPFNWFNSDPRVEAVAPYRGADIQPDNSAENILPLPVDPPIFAAVDTIEAVIHTAETPQTVDNSLFEPTLVSVVIPAAPLAEQSGNQTRFVMLNPVPARQQPVGALDNAGAADSPPNFGPFNPTILIQQPLALLADTLPSQILPAANSITTAAQSVAFLAPPTVVDVLPSVLSRLSTDVLSEVAQNFNTTITPENSGAITAPLAETSLVTVINNLPERLPLLRSGNAIPDQVIPEQAPFYLSSDGYRIIPGAPDLRPPLRPAALVAPQPDLFPGGVNVIQGSPEFTIRRRPAPAPVEVVATELPEVALPEATPEPIDITPPEVANLPSEPSVSVPEQAVETIASNAFTIINGQPERLPLLRSGQPIPDIVLASVTPVQSDNPATAEANRLRPRRRPQAIIDLPEPFDPMLSDAAPADAVRPNHRNDNFIVQAALLAEQFATRPRAVAPPVPVDPPTVNLPASASVARAATIENAINLRKTNLIGIIGTSDARRAIIRLSGGRFVRVELGGTFSGWRVVAIDDSSIRIQKGRREEILRLP